MPGRDPHPELPADPDADSGPEHLRRASLALVAAGGLVGTAARYGIAAAVHTGSTGWPLATFVTNLAGAFVLGVLLEALGRRGPDAGIRRGWRLLGGVGFCGAFTTYSAFAFEVTALFRDGRPQTAFAYAAATLVAGFLLTVLGVAVAARTVAART